MPRVSVVMPNYNGAKYHGEAIASVLAQTYVDFELLVLDDGSSDDSIAIARAFDDPRVHVHALDHGGLPATLNRGIALARGELIARMDSDDVARPERFALQVAYLDVHPEVVVLGGQVELLYGDGRRAPGEPMPCTPDEVLQVLPELPVLLHPTVVMRTAAVRAVGGYRAAYARAEDCDLWLRISERGAIANLSEVVLDFRRHGDNVSYVHRTQQLLDVLAARMAWLTRRATGRDPFEGFVGTFDLATLIAADIPPAVRDEWTAIAFMAAVRYGRDPDAVWWRWVDEAAHARLGPHSSDAFRERVARAHFSLARLAYQEGRRRDVVRHVARAIHIAPRAATRRLVRFARRLVTQ